MTRDNEPEPPPLLGYPPSFRMPSYTAPFQTIPEQPGEGTSSQQGPGHSSSEPLPQREPSATMRRASNLGPAQSPRYPSDPTLPLPPPPNLAPISTARQLTDASPSTAQQINLLSLVDQGAHGGTPGTDQSRWGNIGSMPRDSVFNTRSSCVRERLSVRGKVLEQHFRNMRATPTFAFSGGAANARLRVSHTDTGTYRFSVKYGICRAMPPYLCVCVCVYVCVCMCVVRVNCRHEAVRPSPHSTQTIREWHKARGLLPVS